MNDDLAALPTRAHDFDHSNLMILLEMFEQDGNYAKSLADLPDLLRRFAERSFTLELNVRDYEPVLQRVWPTVFLPSWNQLTPSRRRAAVENWIANNDPEIRHSEWARRNFEEAFSGMGETVDQLWRSDMHDHQGDQSLGEWCENAPLELISLYGTTSIEKDVLGRLLRDPRMGRAWPQIEQLRKLNANSPRLAFDYSGLWGRILTALNWANRDETRRKRGEPTLYAEKQEHALRAVALASRLAEHVGKDGMLDFLAHTLFQDEVERLALGTPSDRDTNAARLALSNTTLVDLLEAFQLRAAEIAKAPPIVKRVRARMEAERDNGEDGKDVRPLTFVRILHDIFFKDRVDLPMHAVMATITNIALKMPPHLEFTGDTVRRALPPAATRQ